MPKRQARKPRAGRTLEVLVASIERALSNQSNVRIDSPAHLPDRVTGEMREHDVLVTLAGGHHNLTIAIECRDRSRKVTVNDVESFSSKCQDTRVGQGVVVSPRGFTAAALKKAKHLGMRCLRLENVEGFNWLLAPGINTRSRHVAHVNWTLYPETNFDKKPPAFTIVTPQGDEISNKAMTDFAIREWNKIPEAQASTDPVQRIHFTNLCILLRDDSNGRIEPIASAVAELHVEVVEGFAPFKLVKYSDSPSGENITDAAIAEIDFGGLKGKVMMVYKEEEGGQIVFVPNKTASN